MKKILLITIIALLFINDSWAQCPSSEITSPDPLVACGNNSVRLNASTGTGYTYYWDKNGIPIAEYGPTLHTSDPGYYHVLITNTITTCQTHGYVTVSQDFPPGATISGAGGAQNICAGGTLQLLTNTGVGITHQWYFNSSIIPGATGSSYFASQPGYYKVKVTNANGCYSESSPMNVSTVSFPDAEINQILGAPQYCVGQVSLGVVNGDPGTFQWLLNGVPISGKTSSTLTSLTQSGDYQVFRSNSDHCDVISAAVHIALNQLPIATQTPSGPVSICNGQPITFNANTGSGLSYQWLKSPNNISSASGGTTSTITAYEAGFYYVKVYGVTGCMSESSGAEVTVKGLQSINFPAITNKTYGDPSFSLPLTTSAGATINYSSSNTAVADIVGNVLTISGSGSVTITASQPGTATVCSAISVSRTFTVAPASLLITPDNKTKTYGAANPNFTVSYSGFVYGETSTVLSTQPVTTSTAGDCSPVTSSPYDITVSGATAANYTITYAVGHLTVSKAMLTITALNYTKIETDPNPVFAYVVTGNLSCTPPPLTGIKLNKVIGFPLPGTYTLSWSNAAADNNFNYTYVPGQFIVTSSPNQVINFTPITTVCTGTSSVNLMASSSAGLPITFSSSNTSIATVSGSVATIVGPGTTTITANSAGNGTYPAASATQDLTVGSTTGTISQSGNMCNGPVTLTAGAGTNYSWGSNTLIASSSGLYTVTYTSVYGCNVSASVTLGCIGGRLAVDSKGSKDSDAIDEDPLAGKFVLFPNPANKEVTIHLKDPIEVSCDVQVIDVMGNGIAHGTMSAGDVQTKINTENLIAGTYVIQINTGKKLIIKRVVVMH